MAKEKEKDVEPILYGPDHKPAQWETHFNKRTQKIKYVVRAGRLGKGRVLAKANCEWGLVSQSKATKKIREILKGFRFVSDIEAENQ